MEDGRYAIRLQARTFVPEPGLDEALSAHIDERQGGQWIHVLMQFAAMPDVEARQRLANQRQVQLLDPVPENAFFAAIPADLSRLAALLASDAGVRWIGAVEPADKLAPQLAQGELSYYARPEEGRAKLIVQFFADVARPRQQEILARYRVETAVRIEPLNAWQVVVDARDIEGLAAEDPVQWIEEIPPPPQDDNDGVRGPGGVDAEAVGASTLYGLTGQGILIGQWESFRASTVHRDLIGRVDVGDPPVPLSHRWQMHTEDVAANYIFDIGEKIYVDIDESFDVSVGDIRSAAVGTFKAGSAVATGDGDIGGSLSFFYTEKVADELPYDEIYTAGEGLYRDNDRDNRVSRGDIRLVDIVKGGKSYAAGSAVVSGDADQFHFLQRFSFDQHEHATHVAGTAIGNGALSLSARSADWTGVAPGSRLRTYAAPPISNAEYDDATKNGVTISTNSWGTGHHNEWLGGGTGYEAGSQYYDSVVSGRKSNGAASGLAGRVLIVGSAGNTGQPERHTDHVNANDRYDAGEDIYIDLDDDGTVSPGDRSITNLSKHPLGTRLVDFMRQERHLFYSIGLYTGGAPIYWDADDSKTVTHGDRRIVPPSGTPPLLPGSLVAFGQRDVGQELWPFRQWGNVRIPNGAKNALMVANISSDTQILSPSSSRGPTLDGRLKPDLAAPGWQEAGDRGVMSTLTGNRYGVKTGTSMATPAVAGIAALLTEWYDSACASGGLTPETARALLVHGAEDLTNMPVVPGYFLGPDFAHGYGRARAKETVDLVPHQLQGVFQKVGSTDIKVQVGLVPELKVTLAWDDPAWTANAKPSQRTGILHNDLDLLLIDPNGEQYTPWELDPTDPALPARRTITAAGKNVPAKARDRRNTIEQVFVEDAMPGEWVIRVSASTLTLPPQDYALVSEVLPPQHSPCTTMPAEVWMRDNGSDGGAEPSSGPVVVSPDVWNRQAADGGTAHQDAELGQTNYLYFNLRSASGDIKATSVDAWLAPVVGGNLVWPDFYTYMGRLSVANMGANSTRQIGPLAWQPLSPAAQYSFYIRIASPQDPIQAPETADVEDNARVSNNIVMRDIDVVDLR